MSVGNIGAEKVVFDAAADVQMKTDEIIRILWE